MAFATMTAFLACAIPVTPMKAAVPSARPAPVTACTEHATKPQSGCVYAHQVTLALIAAKKKAASSAFWTGVLRMTTMPVHRHARMAFVFSARACAVLDTRVMIAAPN
jgi:hypothetical protein